MRLFRFIFVSWHFSPGLGEDLCKFWSHDMPSVDIDRNLAQRIQNNDSWRTTGRLCTAATSRGASCHVGDSCLNVQTDAYCEADHTECRCRTVSTLISFVPFRKNALPGMLLQKDAWTDAEALEKGWGSGIGVGDRYEFEMRGFREGYMITTVTGNQTISTGPYWDTQLAFLNGLKGRRCIITLTCTNKNGKRALELDSSFDRNGCFMEQAADDRGANEECTKSGNENAEVCAANEEYACKKLGSCVWKNDTCERLMATARAGSNSIGCLPESETATVICCNVDGQVVLSSCEGKRNYAAAVKCCGENTLCQPGSLTQSQATSNSTGGSSTKLQLCSDPTCSAWVNQRCTFRRCCTPPAMARERCGARCLRQEKIVTVKRLNSVVRRPSTIEQERLVREGHVRTPFNIGMRCRDGIMGEGVDFAVDYVARCEHMTTEAKPWEHQWIWSCAVDAFNENKTIRGLNSASTYCKCQNVSAKLGCQTPAGFLKPNKALAGWRRIDGRGRNRDYKHGDWFKIECRDSTTQWYERKKVEENAWKDFPFINADDPDARAQRMLNIVCDNGEWKYDHSLLYRKRDLRDVYKPEVAVLSPEKVRSKAMETLSSGIQSFPSICVKEKKTCADVAASWAQLPNNTVVKSYKMTKENGRKMRDCVIDCYNRRIGNASNYDIEYFSQRFTGCQLINLVATGAIQYEKNECELTNATMDTIENLHMTFNQSSTIYKVNFNTGEDDACGKHGDLGDGLTRGTIRPPGPEDECNCGSGITPKDGDL